MTIGDAIYDSGIPSPTKRGMAREWLKAWQLAGLDELRAAECRRSDYFDWLTAVMYFFMPDDGDFAAFEFAILQTWKAIGKLRTVIVANRDFASAGEFCARHRDVVEIQIEPMLAVGDIRTMSEDCVLRLHRRFATPYCLVVQDDGFPLSPSPDLAARVSRAAFDEFIGRYDYVGAPSVRENFIVERWVDATRCAGLNGGFSLRSRRICRDVAEQWGFWRRFVDRDSPDFSEDMVFSRICCRNPLFRLRNRFPSSRVARRFSLPDFDGVVDVRNTRTLPFGVHGATAIWQLAGIGGFGR